MKHINGLSKELRYRFGKDHFTQSFIEWCEYNPPNIQEGEITTHPQCFAVSYPQCIVPGDPVKGYQNYYNELILFQLFVPHKYKQDLMMS